MSYDCPLWPLLPATSTETVLHLRILWKAGKLFRLKYLSLANANGKRKLDFKAGRLGGPAFLECSAAGSIHPSAGL
jgi:hypothetical protein